MRARVAVTALAVTVLLGGCGGKAADPADAGRDVGDVAAILTNQVPSITDKVMVTEDNDSAGMLGQPGQYDQALFLADQRLGCAGPSYEDLAVRCGALLERWPTPEAAHTRSDRLLSGRALGTAGKEHHYVVGRTLVRVTDELAPAEVREYADALE